MRINHLYRSTVTVLSLLFFINVLTAETPDHTELQISMARLESELVKKYGASQYHRLKRGMQQVAQFWHNEDGSPADFESFVQDHFAGTPAALDTMFFRYQRLLEQIDGHMNKIVVELRRQSDLDTGPIEAYDDIFAGYDPSAHLADDFFNNKLAFVVLLNFPLTTLEERLNDGQNWSRRQWAEARLAQRYASRVPADVKLAIAKAAAASDKYIAEYNIWMHHLIDAAGSRLFPAGMRLLSHWNLRDEIKAQYSEGPAGLSKQRMIERVMEHIVYQTIPDIVVDNPHVDWNPVSNEVKPASVQDSELPIPENMSISNSPEPDIRYEILLNTFLAARMEDPYWPTAPSLIARRFDINREIPEERVQNMFERIIASPLIPEIAKLIQQRLDRDLEPFDIWYNGFRPRGRYSEADLDKIVMEKYPDAAAFAADMPAILQKLGFDPERARYLADNIIVEPARGSGHAWGAQMREEKARLRTRIGPKGMDYKGYNIAVHELGHNVEQTFSLNNVDHTLLEGVPNTAFTEAMAFVFQDRDLELLGLSEPDEKASAMQVLDDFWGTYEIAGVALVDMAVWHWMYDNPEATPAELKNATIEIARNIWNQYYAPVFKKRDVVLLAIYSHMIHSFLYLPDYPIGHLIARQIENQMEEAGNLGTEFERMTTYGRVPPDIWMKHATGFPVGPEALIEATENALRIVAAE